MYSKVFCLILAFALLQIAYTADCERCTFSADGKDDKGPCTQCDEGTCTPEKGTIGTTQLACSIKKCQAGKFSETGYDSDGKGKGCTNCNPGTYSIEGSTECNLIPCGYGYYSETGYYDQNEGSRYNECEICPYGRSTTKENTIGDYDEDEDIICDLQLEECPEGTYSDTGYDSDGIGTGCQKCEPGTHSIKGSDRCSLKVCGVGTYSSTGYYNTINYEKCTVCPIGKSTDKEMTIGKDDKVCTLQLKQCPEGTFSTTGYNGNTKESECKKCKSGTHSLLASKSCQLRPCDYGYYSNTGYFNINKEINCTKCPLGKSTKEQQTIGEDEKVCDVQLQFCPQGKFSYSGYDFDGEGKGNGCSDCYPGTYSLVGSKSCDLTYCGYGYYNINGYYNHSKEAECQKCPIGKSTPLENTQGTDDKVCSVQSNKCPENKWSNTGYDYDGKGKGCKYCESGTYSFEGSTTCDLKSCGYNFYSQTGFYITNQKEECKACPENTYTDGYINESLDDSICLSYNSSDCDESESEGYDNSENTSNSIIIKTTLSLILLVALF
ncbi:hypothetical protein TTHERM_00448880 (macronuclear) [Tetrahymena thermophila SB210]|uniref:GCC2 and GCC3 family protein n=1 Tax=Tetrahymena thermophila (strain SB210) TaxID=312017 RepID=Q239C7_TETTS|nr:hypothetical protein TTHERM_00448880 [Tetrahymena thermophila SB210]EAR93043.1 hypothetical protein TTHERM_00448880 [Tetrahymena thermophila SB210]|eukprot:XP_001013288.1 hypothetical protein TTHERM_00448880 [Tetrahymena thermophila SB210]